MEKDSVIQRIGKDRLLDVLTLFMLVTLFLGVVLKDGTLAGRINETAGSAVLVALIARTAYIIVSYRRSAKTAGTKHEANKPEPLSGRPAVADMVLVFLLTAYFVALYIVALPVKPFLHLLFWILIASMTAAAVAVTVLYSKRRPKEDDVSV